MNKEDLEEFENQFEQEKLEKLQVECNSRSRKVIDGTIYELHEDGKTYVAKVDDEFIAQHYLNYGDSSAPFWQNPPSDITSEEYKVWYGQYQKYFESLKQKTAIPAAMSSSAKDVDDPEYFEQLLHSKTDVDDDKNNEHKKLQNKKDKKANKNKKEDEKIASTEDIAKSNQTSTEPNWFDIEETKNTNVYVNGLPSEITLEEFKELMNKVGLVAYDPVQRKPKIKLYTDAEGNFKGDGRCCYMKPESVDLALKILDDSEFKGHRITVEKARFQQKGQFDPSKRKRKLTKNEKKKFEDKQSRLLAWLPEKVEETRPRCERIVVIKNVFLPKEFEEDPSLINEISADMREECSKFGDVRKVVVYDRHDDGVVTVTFKTPDEADICIRALHGRWFARRQLTATNWDGKTKYLVRETEQEMEERLKKWHNFLENDASSSITSDNLTNNPTEKNEEEHLKSELLSKTGVIDESIEKPDDQLRNGNGKKLFKCASDCDVNKEEIIKSDEVSSMPDDSSSKISENIMDRNKNDEDTLKFEPSEKDFNSETIENYDNKAKDMTE